MSGSKTEPAIRIVAGKEISTIERSYKSDNLQDPCYWYAWSKVSAPKLIAYLLKTFGPHGSHSILNPDTNITHLTWEKPIGLYLTLFYADDLSGIVNLVAFCTRTKTWLNFLEILDMKGVKL